MYIIRILFFSIPLTLAFCSDVVAQCGIPGTPACTQKRKTVRKKTTKKPNPETKTSTTIVQQPASSTMVIVQPAERLCLSPDVENLKVKCPDDVRIGYLDPGNDQGYDFATVLYDKVLLREYPQYVFSPGKKCFASYSPYQEQPCTGNFLDRGDMLVILKRNDTYDWLNVIDLKSGKEGWVYKSHLKIEYTSTFRTQEPVFREQYTTSYEDPRVRVSNESAKTLNLKLGGILYVVAPNSQKEFTLSPGTYEYVASSPGVLPSIGSMVANRGKIYTWRFYVVTWPR